MARIGIQTKDNGILVALASAIVRQPAASLQELASAVGISKATLYRFCRTREQLIERLTTHGVQLIGEAIAASGLDTASPREALRRLIVNNLEQRELTTFLIYCRNQGASEDFGDEAGWDIALDAFFLRGQREGVFRIDMPAAMLTELFVAMLLGLVEAERRGRVARAGLAATMESAFLKGVAADEAT
ncbi:TetR/AcrR family transcriptional repressor of mexCD-oprJ operon [Pseudochelatococcus lubricantis]|uniref:TetR/AcrR family transcriptional repressor of mexCD-oprJ operon n=1 Tax=Pseudochelatococcus lubricantis TaxID=1538102 RepID=A0ABX0UX70_9HYPH|nr:TetR/AcrR family transcriptional regulator [Pseudochelatococcus lubricantis]NIJ57542.1 TetR/AcrR family transcriptional repressor of mexCD-oprJ operon [Pseudochelatococcus lubricantis]